MAYDNSNNGGNKTPTIYENYGAIFNEDKAMSMGMSGNKFRISFANQIRNNGNPQWDFKNQSGVTLEIDDIHSIYLAAKELIHIYLTRKDHPELVGQYPLLMTEQISVPLVARSSGMQFGEFITGYIPPQNPKDPAKFYIRAIYKGQGDTNMDDCFYFRIGNEDGHVQYRDTNGIQIGEARHYNIQFATYVRTLESSIALARMLHGVNSSIRFGRSGGTQPYRSTPQGAPGGGGNSYGQSTPMSMDSGIDGADDIPF